jgi:hypothetical protein
MSEREIIVPLSDLIKIEVKCKECGSGAVFAFRKETVHTISQKRPGQDPLQSCPSCNTYFGLSLLAALVKWQELISFSQQNSQFRLQFHVSGSTTPIDSN